jgi:hypothetical protein
MRGLDFDLDILFTMTMTMTTSYTWAGQADSKMQYIWTYESGMTILKQ